MVVLESKSTDTATYAEAAREQPEFIPMLSMLENNVVANQDAWDEAFQTELPEPHLSWALDEEEGISEDKVVNQSPPPCVTHISSGLILEGTTID